VTISTYCPGCGDKWVKQADETLQPEVGDVTICYGCGRVLRFVRGTFGLRLAGLSARDERALARAVRERLNDLQPRTR
jgi:hypothetical protein